MSIKENRKKWVAALRSGEYKQGNGYLCKMNGQGEFRFCCLGVLCEIAGAQKNDELHGEKKVIISYGTGAFESAACAPREAMDFVGLDDEFGSFGAESLSKLNDTGFNFEQIADIIESEPEGMFDD